MASAESSLQNPHLMSSKTPEEIKGNNRYGRHLISDSEYNLIHRWVASIAGKAKRCVFCNKKSGTKYEWALLKGEKYERNVNNFIELCCSCHRKYDMTEESKKVRSIIHKGKPSRKKKEVSAYDKNGILNGTYESVTIAARYTGTNRSSIQSCLIGRYEYANNLSWKYSTSEEVVTGVAAEEIFKQAAQKFTGPFLPVSHIEKLAMIDYARIKCAEQREICSNKAECETVDGQVWAVKHKSIISAPAPDFY